jgi:type I restriction enzyme S subunit
MSNKEIKIGEYFFSEIAGDWGDEVQSDDCPLKVKCIRGADIEGACYGNISLAPTRYIKSSNKSKILTVGDIIIEISGGSPTQSTGRAALVTTQLLNNAKIPVVCSNFCRALRVKEGYDPKFVFYSLRNIYKHDVYSNFEGKTTGIKNLDLSSALKSIPAISFERPDQSHIASVLSAFDDKIEINNRIKAELEGMAKTLYDYWFVQFDFPDKNGKPYKTNGGKMVWDTELKRNIPDGWEVKKLGKELDTVLGGTPSTRNKSFWENGVFNWLNSGEVAGFPIVSSEMKITEEAIHSSATELLPKGTTLLSITRHLRPTILAIDACANQSVVGIKEKGEIKCNYIYPYLKNQIPKYLSLRTGAQQPHINKEIVDDSFIIFPQKNSDILNKYNKITEPIYSQIINNALQNQQLGVLRDWLLPILMNGQLKVK